MERQFVNNKVVGFLESRVFYQLITTRHIYRRYQAKGMDTILHRTLKGKCYLWRLKFEDTGQVLSIPFDKIQKVGFEVTTKGAGKQIMVKLKDFEEETKPLQKQLF